MSDASTEPHTPPKLPVWKTARGAYGFFFGHYKALSLLLPTAYLIWALLLRPLQRLVRGQIDLVGSIPISPLVIAVVTDSLISLVLLTIVSVLWHRAYLLPSTRPRIRELLRLRRGHLKFFLYSILFGAVVSAAAYPVLMVISSETVGWTMDRSAGRSTYDQLFRWSVVDYLSSWVVTIVAAIIGMRISLVLPASAIESTLGLKGSWILTKENGWQIFAITLLMVAPMQILRGGLLLIVPPGPTLPILYSSLGSLINLMQLLLAVSALSATFRFLTSEPPPPLPQDP